jgi:hypothetical protein
MTPGTCELCHALADLRDSHYLPKSGYKKMRASDLKSPNPVLLSGGKAKHARCRSGITNFAVLARSGSIRAMRRGF